MKTFLTFMPGASVREPPRVADTGVSASSRPLRSGTPASAPSGPGWAVSGQRCDSETSARPESISESARNPPPRAHKPGAAAVGCHDRRSGRKIRRVRAAASRAPRTPRAAKMRAGFSGGGAGWRRATSRPPWTSSRRFAPHDSYTIVVWLRCGFDRRHNQCAIKIISM